MTIAVSEGLVLVLSKTGIDCYVMDSTTYVAYNGSGLAICVASLSLHACRLQRVKVNITPVKVLLGWTAECGLNDWGTVRACICSRGTNSTRPLMMVRGSPSPTSTCSTYRLRVQSIHISQRFNQAQAQAGDGEKLFVRV